MQALAIEQKLQQLKKIVTELLENNRDTITTLRTNDTISI